jgi:4-diphosphocytidyl-2-C-methyl-D-erythritol kinase
MLQFPNAKINLGLYITSRREDGYHDLETVFYPVEEMRDALEIVPCKGTTSALIMSGLPVNVDKKSNLVWKAFELLKTHYPDKVGDFDIYLHKAIPMGAGLGGGSADAAWILRMLDELCELGLSTETLEAFALTLGSDCPFFIRNNAQIDTGRGEVMEAVPVDLSAYRIKVVCPGIHVGTAEAFQNILPKPPGFDLRELGNLPIGEWKGKVSNDFEETVFALYPEIGEIKERLYDEGALYASMSGTGSAVYGVFGKN